MIYKYVYYLSVIIGVIKARSIIDDEPPGRVLQCHSECLEKFVTEDFACLQRAECSMCWDKCEAIANSKFCDSTVVTLDIRSMVRQGSLVTLNVDWTCVNGTRRIVDNHCLVSWEISGGGLIGNLLTDATSAELSLWTNAKYHIQVTCKNKVSEEWFQSQSLTVDTRSAKNVTLTSTPAPTTAEDTPLYLDQTEELDALDNFEETDAILQIHRAKDKDVKTTQEQDNTENAIDVQIYPIISKYRFRQLFTANPVSGIWRIYEGKKEFVLGVILAIILFLILSILVINTKRKSRLVHKVYLMSSYKIDAADYEEERKDERRVKRIVQKKRPRHDGVEILQRDEKIIHV